MVDQPAIIKGFSLSAAQQTAVVARDCDVAVTAGAGTGKTRTLVARYLSLLDEGLPLREIAALTFTRKAAREMRNRVRREIEIYLAQEKLSDEETIRWQMYANELDAARIGTIHNLCADILRTHPAQVAIDPQFAVLDEAEAAMLAQEAVEMTLGWAVEEEGLLPLFSLLREKQLWELLEFFLQKRLDTRAALQRVEPESILEHWRAQVQAAKNREQQKLLEDAEFKDSWRVLAENEAQNRDDKAEQQRLAAVRALQNLYSGNWEVSACDLAILEGLSIGVGIQNNWPGGKEQLLEVKEAFKIIRELVKERPLLKLQINGQDEAIAAAMPAVYAAAAKVQEVYQDLKQEYDALDFDDLEDLSIDLLREHEDVRAYWQSQIKALLVDEFQDTNEQQRRFMRLLCPQDGKLFIVGDGKQSIYRFRGADVSVFAHEKEVIGRQGGQLIDLHVSYRAHEALLTGMNRLLRPVLGSDGPDREAWEAPFTALEAGTKAVRPDLGPPFVEFHLALGSKGKALPLAAGALAGRLAELHNRIDLDYGQMAILCRAAGSFQYYEDALDEAGIPYQTVAGKGFYDRPEIRDLLNALQAVADPHDDLALVGLLRSPACGLSDVTLFHLAARKADHSLWESLQRDIELADEEEKERVQTAVALVRDLNRQAGRLPVAAILNQFLARTYYRAILCRAGEVRALRNVTKLQVDVHDSGLVSVATLLEYINLLRESVSRVGEARAVAGGAVQIMTIHAAKGLEFPVVVLGDIGSMGGGARGIIVDRELGILLPGKNEEQQRAACYELGLHKEKQQDGAERARLLYVALTRAEQMLLISGTGTRLKSGKPSWPGRLGQLVDICGLDQVDLTAYDELGSRCHLFDLMVEETAVRAAIYEPGYVTQANPMLAAKIEPIAGRTAARPLQEGLNSGGDREMGGDRVRLKEFGYDRGQEQRIETVRAAGLLTHNALAAWRFPGPGFEDWMMDQSKLYRLDGAAQIGQVVELSSQMLARLSRHPLYLEVMSAWRRLHEVPYSIESEGRVENGRIDLLFEDDRGWTVVDFKIGYVKDEAALTDLLAAKGVERQLRQYGTAVWELIGKRPRLLLCLLNYHGELRLHEIHF